MERPGRRRATARLAGLAVLAVVPFLPAVGSGFVADDFILLRTLERFDGVAWAFSHNDLGQGGGAGHFYRPLWVLWHAALDRLSDGDPAAFHAGNLVLYALITLQVWALVRRLAGEWAAWVAAAGFAVYPRHGESVAWISGSTDLVATAFGLAALLCTLAGRRPMVWAVSASAFAAAAALAKESAFVVPVLALIVLWAATGRLRWAVPSAMLGAQLVVLAVRAAVVGGAGGYSEYPWTPVRVVGVAVSYVAAALSPPQLELLRYPPLLVVPAGLGALALWRLLRLRRLGEHGRVRLAVAGALWFAVSLVPALNLAVDLNTANGERLLFLPSVGLALALGALAPLPSARMVPALAAAGVAALALSAHSARNWVTAERVAGRVVTAAAQLGPPGGELVLVTVPANYRTAHVFPGATLAAALERAGRSDLRVAVCISIYLREEQAGAVQVARRPDGALEARSTWAAPFDVPVLRDPSPLGPDCAYEVDDSWPPGLELRAVARPGPSVQPAALGFFDGRDLRPIP